MQDRAEMSVGYAPFSASPSTSTHGPFLHQESAAAPPCIKTIVH